MAFTKDNLDKFTKQQVIEVVLNLQKEHKDNKAKMDDMNNRISKMEKKIEELLLRNEELVSKDCVSGAISGVLEKKMQALETEINLQQQYSRRECLEIVGIPLSEAADGNGGDVLEGKVLEIFKAIGVEMSSNDVQACHRLKGNDRVIIKLSNRKHVHQVLTNKRKLRERKNNGYGQGFH
jgi:seryl-tRNA synthetase